MHREVERASDDVDADARGGFGSLGSIVYVLLLAWGAFLALLPLNDNSFFTHLATGRLILDRGGVPSSDPYSFTAAGEPWTVQSWLASVAYAGAEQAGGTLGIRLFVLAVFLLATTAVWWLSQPARSFLLRVALVSVAMVVSSGTWSERPYMIGFLGLAVLWGALHGRIGHWWLVPLLWVWANTHGSFPLAIVLWVAVTVGAVLDQRFRGQDADLQRKLLVLRSIAIGLALAVISPLGLRALTFPFGAFARTDTFQLIVEWQAPEFTSAAERAFLLLVLGAVASLVAVPSWRRAIPVLVFVAAALTARRNVVMAVPVLVPIIAAGLPDVGTLRARVRPALGRPLAVLAVAVLGLVVVASLGRPGWGVGGYPVQALAFREATVPDARLVAQDFTGNFLELLDGTEADVFIDDRVDMFDDEVIQDYGTLNTAGPGWSQVLERWDAEVVAWRRDHPLGAVLAADPRWRLSFSDAEWFLAERR